MTLSYPVKEFVFVKIIQKFLCIAVFTLALLGVVLWLTPQPATPLPQFVIQAPDASAQKISIYDAGDGNYYVFLPSYARMEELTVSLPRFHDYALEETLLSDGMTCGDFGTDTPYDFSVDHREVASLRFCSSANVATMYVDTVSGSMKYLHQNKEHKETASLALYTADGQLQYSHSRISLSGRGNASWEYDKRPYTVTLPSDHAMLDMPAAAKWILLANAADETNLNNKLMLDLAKNVGLRWTPECRWVDLYLNGEYSGLYLLAEKVEVHPNRVDLDPGDFLCRIDLEERWSTLSSPFLTEGGRTVEVCYPRIPAAGQPEAIRSRVNELEQTILSGEDLSRSDVLDLDSWVRRYLIDEISANIDADLASSYFYSREGKIWAGPLWDYDMTLGNFPRNQDPHAFIAKNLYKSDSLVSPFYGALYENPSFYSRMVELYRTEFVPQLQMMQDGGIDRLIEHIADASRCNSIRWRTMYDNLTADVVHSPEALKDYFSRRIRFLDSAWLEGTRYCTVQFESRPGSAYRSVSVKQGRLLETPYINTDTTVWVDSETGEVFDFSQSVTADRILSKQDS